jgi:hypothetical protein
MHPIYNSFCEEEKIKKLESALHAANEKCARLEKALEAATNKLDHFCSGEYRDYNVDGQANETLHEIKEILEGK